MSGESDPNPKDTDSVSQGEKDALSGRDILKNRWAVWRHRIEATPELLEAYAKWRHSLIDSDRNKS